jgi:hypothetical protein
MSVAAVGARMSGWEAAESPAPPERNRIMNRTPRRIRPSDVRIGLSNPLLRVRGLTPHDAINGRT